MKFHYDAAELSYLGKLNLVKFQQVISSSSRFSFRSFARSLNGPAFSVSEGGKAVKLMRMFRKVNSSSRSLSLVLSNGGWDPFRDKL
jgi:hypothetical protein